MSKLNILITTSYYWPEDTGNAPYVTGLAKHLAEQGHDVVVATTFQHYPEWTSTAHGRLGATELHAGVRILRRWTYVPRTQSAAHRALYELSLVAVGLTALPWGRRPDVVIGTCPTLAGGVLAAVAARRHGVPYGLVFQDLMGLAASQSGVAGGRVAGAVRAAELRLAAGAARVGVIAEGFRKYLEAGGVAPEKIDRLRNWTRRAEPSESRSDTRRRFGWADDDFVCMHGGNMGQKQGLDNLLDAADLLPRDRIRIALVGDGNDRPRLEQIARGRRLSNVDFIEMQGPGKWEATMQAADVLLVNQRASVMDMSLPSKLTSYFASGQPVLAAVSADSETAYEIESAKAGLVVPPGDPAALRDAILALETDRARTEALGAGGRDYAAGKLARENALREYDVFVDRILAAARPR